MDLDNLKTTWQEYDRKLEKSLKLNEELLRQINLNQSRNELKAPLRWEYFSLIGNSIGLLYVIYLTISYHKEVNFLITGLITIFFTIYYIWMNVQKIKALSSINYSSATIIEVQKSVLHFETIYQKAKKGELLTLIPFLIGAFIMVFRGIYKINMFEDIQFFFTMIAMSIPFCILITLWIYKSWYEKRVKKVLEFLNKMEEFEKE